MSEVILQFPSTNHIADFLVNYNLTSIEVDTTKLIVKGYLTETELTTALKEYDAEFFR